MFCGVYNWENFHDFLLGEVRYLSVKKAYPNEAEELFAEVLLLLIKIDQLF